MIICIWILRKSINVVSSFNIRIQRHSFLFTLKYQTANQIKSALKMH
jgi:hypothetical protein